MQAAISLFDTLSTLATTGTGSLESALSTQLNSFANLDNYDISGSFSINSHGAISGTGSISNGNTTIGGSGTTANGGSTSVTGTVLGVSGVMASSILHDYDQLIAASSTNGMGHATACLKSGKAMMSIASAISKKSGENDASYHQYLEMASTTPGASAEASSTLAWHIGGDSASADVLAMTHDSNEASLNDIVHHIVGYVSAIGSGGGSGAMNTKLPVGQEGSWMRPDQKLETLIKGGDAIASSANNTNADGSKKGLVDQAIAKIGGSLLKALAYYYQFVLRLLVVLCAGLPFIVLLTQVCIATTVANISYALGMAILPIWAVMNAGKLFSSASAGDESYNGVTFFPIVAIIVTTACLGAEVAAAKVCQGEVQFYLTHIVDIFFAQVESIGYALGMVFSQSGQGNHFKMTQVLTPMMEAVKPFGICAAATIAPMLIGRILMPGVIAPHGSASMVAGMASSAHEGGAAAVGGKVKSAAMAAATGGGSLAVEGGAAKGGAPTPK
jgi:hypothetical protein